MYSCVICSSIAWLVFSSAPKSGDAGSRTWKSIGPCLIWTIALSSNCAVERLEVVVRGARPIVLRIVPVHVMVVDEAAIEDHAAVRRQRARDDVRGVGVGAAVCRGPTRPSESAFSTKPAEVGNRADRGRPPASSTTRSRPGRAGRRSAACRASAGCRNRSRARAARPTGAGRRRRARPAGMNSGDRTSGLALTLLIEMPLMPSEASSRPYSSTRRQILADMAVLPEDRSSAIAALDRAVDVVPLVDPAHAARTGACFSSSVVSGWPSASLRSSANAP